MFPENPPPHEWDEEQWKEAFKSLLRVTVQFEERVEDAVAGGWALGRRRSRLLSRDLIIPVDVGYGLSIFCFIWLKPPALPENYDYLIQNRWRIFQGARHHPDPEERFIEVVPDWLLRLDTHQLHGILQNAPIRRFIRIPSE